MHPGDCTFPLEPFTVTDQQAFGELSGDVNPVHMDVAAARRTLFGRPVAHGLHLVLRALETMAASGASVTFRAWSARFQRPVFLDEALVVDVKAVEGGLDLHCLSDGAQLALISLRDPGHLPTPPWSPVLCEWRREPLALAIEEMAGRGGVLSLPYSEPAIRSLFPRLTDLYGVNVVAHLMAVTRVIGMEIPGLHSMLATLSLRLLGGRDAQLNYSVNRVTPKISHVQIGLESAVVKGVADAFVRPVAEEAQLSSVASRIAVDEFKGRKCLIVGGSRGLGLLAGRILAAGGAEVMLSYRVGRDLAMSAAEALRKAGARAGAVALDVQDPDPAFEALGNHNFHPTDLYYFATPHIFVRKKALFEVELLNQFIEIYVSSFLGIVERTKKISASRLSIFYPSSEAVDRPMRDLAEYYIAKVAGEAACAMLAQFDPQVSVISERLPRLPTDQTASLTKIATAAPAPILLDICRRMMGPHP